MKKVREVQSRAFARKVRGENKVRGREQRSHTDS